MKKEFVSMLLIYSLFLVSFAFAIEIPEDFEMPDKITPEMISQIPDEYLTPELYAEIFPELMDTYCILIEPYKSEIIGQEIPKQIPFKSEVFSLYIVDQPIASLHIEEKIVSDMTCGNVSEDTTYKIYISGLEIFNEINEETNYIDFYKAKKKSGDIKIKGVGLGRNIKLFFLNMGVNIAGWFI